MSICIVAQGHVRPGQDTGVLDAAMRQDGRRTAGSPIRCTVRLLRSVANPAVLLLLTESGIDLTAAGNRPGVASTPAFDALCVGETEHWMCRRRSIRETLSRTSALDCALVVAPAAARNVVLTLSEQVLAPAVCALPGFAVRYTYQDVDDPNRLLMLQGWDSPAALQRFLREMAPRLSTSLGRLGAAVTWFVGPAGE